MMYGNDWGHNMMQGYGGWGTILWIILFVDLVLAGVWLFKQVLKK